MGSFKCWYRRTCLFSHILTRLTCLSQEETSVRTNVVDACICSISTYIAASNAKGPQAGSFVTQCYKKHAHSIHFYTNAHVLMPIVTFYDVKPQSVKIPISAKPSDQITHANVH